MKAVVLDEFGQTLAFQEIPEPEPGKGEVLVKVEACASGMVRSRGRNFPSFWDMRLPGRSLVLALMLKVGPLARG